MVAMDNEDTCALAFCFEFVAIVAASTRTYDFVVAVVVANHFGLKDSLFK